MAENLLLEINPVLLEAMDVSGDSGKLTYFQLLGLSPNGFTPADVDKAVMAKSRALRVWQNSPQHGEETVKLLPMLHRIATVLKDPKRREAYAQEVSRILSGTTVDPVEEFREMVRAALSDGVLDTASKAELLRYATSHSIPHAEAGRILNEMSAKLERAPSGEMAAPGWEFRLAEGEVGPDAFRAAVEALLEGSAFNPDSRARILEEHKKFAIDLDVATAIVNTLAGEHFRLLASHVARSGVLSDNQARLLMPKARNLGLDQSDAYEILSEFTFTSASEQDIATLNLSAVGFDSGEITNLLAKQESVLYKQKKGFAGALGGLVITIAIIGVGIGVIYFVISQFSSSGSTEYVPVTTIEPTPEPKPLGPWIKPKPDPTDGMLVVSPTLKVKNTEVTCAEYQTFLKDMFYPNRPPGWAINYDFPDGHADMPVTGVTWNDAMEFCKWKARELGVAADSVRLPQVAEYLEMLKAPILGGKTASTEKFWSSAGFHLIVEPAKIKANKESDTLYFEAGRLYDLLSNVAEWGADEKNGERAVLGGDFTRTNLDFNPLNPNYRDPASADAQTGFRYVVVQ